MHTVEIPPAEWRTFLDRFARVHLGHLCTLALFGPDRNRQARLRPLMLAGLGAERDADDPRIRVLLSDWYGDQVAHIVDAPHHVFLERGGDGINEVLAIDGAEGRTVMSFQAAD